MKGTRQIQISVSSLVGLGAFALIVLLQDKMGMPLGLSVVFSIVSGLIATWLMGHVFLYLDPVSPIQETIPSECWLPPGSCPHQDKLQSQLEFPQGASHGEVHESRVLRDVRKSTHP